MNRYEQIGIFIEDTVSSIVDQPAAVELTIIRQADNILYRLFLAPKDMNKVTGKGVQTERSLRVILSAIGTKLNQRLLLEVAPREQPSSFAGWCGGRYELFLNINLESSLTASRLNESNS